MKIILLKDIAKLGRKYDTKEVSSGYALNLLIPKGLAISATSDAVKKIDVIKAKEEGERKVHEDLLQKNIKDADGISISYEGKANEKGHLFAGLHRDEIAAELKKQKGIEIDPSFLEIEHPIKEIGEHKIVVKKGEKIAKFNLIIKAA